MDKDTEIIKDEDIELLKNRRIFFGHASVGYNIINGIEYIVANNSRYNGINIQEPRVPFEVDGPAIYHTVNGKNGFPKIKIDAFKQTLEKNLFANKIDIAFFKFCYVDFTR